MQELDTKLQLGDNESSSYYMMEQLAQNTGVIDIDIVGDKLVERTKLFMVAHARCQLNRIIKMTKFMERLEDKFIDAVNTRLDNEPGNISMISMAMETITKCIEKEFYHEVPQDCFFMKKKRNSLYKNILFIIVRNT